MRVAIYVRKSVAGDEKSISLNDQEQRCKDYFKIRGKECTFTLYKDDGWSGKNKFRPDFQRLLDDISANKYDAAVCYKFDRIARNALDFLTVLELFKQYGTDLISVNEGYDPTTPEGKLMVTFLASIAEMERENIRQRAISSMNNLARQGRWTGGKTPFGYHIIRKEYGVYLELDNPEQIEYIFKSYLNGEACFNIAKKIGKTSRGLKVILKNPLYMQSSQLGDEYLRTLGYDVENHKESDYGPGYMTYGKNSNSELLKIAAISEHKAVITAADWIACQERLKLCDGHAYPRISKKTWLAQLVKCKFCGSQLFVKEIFYKEESKLYLKATCKCLKKYLKVADAEKEVLEKIKLINTVENEESTFNPVNTEIDIINSQINNKEKTIKGLINQLGLASESISKRIMKTIEELESEIENLNESKLQKLILLEGTPKLKKTFNTAEEMDKFIATFNTLDVDEKQQAIRNIISVIEFDGENLYLS